MKSDARGGILSNKHSPSQGEVEHFSQERDGAIRLIRGCSSQLPVKALEVLSSNFGKCPRPPTDQMVSENCPIVSGGPLHRRVMLEIEINQLSECPPLSQTLRNCSLRDIRRHTTRLFPCLVGCQHAEATEGNPTHPAVDPPFEDE